MKTSINLVSKKRRPSEFHRRFFLASIIFFSVVFILSAGLVGYRLVLQIQMEELTAEEAQLTSDVNSDPEKKVKFLTVRERLSEIQDIMKKRQNLNTRVESVAQTLPADVGVRLIESDKNIVKVRVSASDLVSLDNLIDQRIEEYASERNRGVKRVELTGFNLNPKTLLYEASFTIEFT